MRLQMSRSSTLSLLPTLVLFCGQRAAEGFLPIDTAYRRTLGRPLVSLRYDASADGETHLFDSGARKELDQRIRSLRREVLEEEWRRPPNANCSPEELVEEILTALWDSDDPMPDSGFLLLLRTATKQWRAQILKSVGAPASGEVDWQVVSSALGAAIGRPHNQFSILVAGDAGDEHEKAYVLEFPFEPLDYNDGSAWLECRMRDRQTRELLVITGWSLKQREDGAWLVDGISWHDLRYVDGRLSMVSRR